MMDARFLAGLCSVTFRKRSAGEVIALAASAGLDAIEWGADVHVPPGQREVAETVASATRAAGLAVSSYGSYLRMPESSEAEVREVVETAALIGAPLVRVWPGEKGRPSADYRADERTAVARAIDTAAALAAGKGIALGLEYHPHTLTDALASSEALMAEITASNVYLYWQPRPGIAPQEALEELDRLGHHVAHLHVFQWDGEKQRYPLAQGRADWERYLSRVPNGRWCGQRYAMIEFVAGDDAAAFAADARTLHELTGGPTRT